MTVAPTETSTGGANLPESIAAVQAAVTALNDRGGIKGQQVELTVCNNKNDATAAAACGQQAVDEKVVAVVGMYSQTGGEMAPLESASIPAVGSVGIAGDGSELTSKMSFVYYNPVFGFVACPSVLAADGVKQIGGISSDVAASQRTAALVQAGGVAAGKPIDPNIKLPLNTSDYAPAAAQLVDGGADGVTMVSTEQGSVALMRAGGNKLKYCNAQGALSEPSLASAGPSAAGFYESGPFPPFSAASEYPELQQFTTEMDAAFASGDKAAAPELRKATSLNAWLAVQAVDKVAEQISGDVTSASLLDQLNKTTDLDLGVVPPLNFTQQTPIPGLDRLFNTTVRANKWDAASKQLVPASDTLYNGLELLSKSQG
ncbi:ABC transporter substrate-binding protein [Gordonia insulae]|nr:ABC transporter substrate-binding protein [Gordonia insulae]